MNPLLKRSDMARDSKGITQFYLSPTHEPYLPLLPSRRASPPYWLVLIVPTHGGMARLSWTGWLVIHWDRFSGTGDWTPDTVTHLSTNRAGRRLTSSMETNALTTTPNRQPSTTLWLLLQKCLISMFCFVQRAVRDLQWRNGVWEVWTDADNDRDKRHQYHSAGDGTSCPWLYNCLLHAVEQLSLIHIWRCRRIERCRSRWSPYH